MIQPKFVAHLEDDKDNFGHLWIRRRPEHPIIVFAEGHVEQPNPGGVVLCVQGGVLVRLYDEEESLAKAKKADGVDNGKSEHVPCDHLEDHGDKGPGELDGAAEEHEVKPGSGHREDKESFLYCPAHLLLLTKLIRQV